MKLHLGHELEFSEKVEGMNAKMGKRKIIILKLFFCLFLAACMLNPAITSIAENNDIKKKSGTLLEGTSLGEFSGQENEVSFSFSSQEEMVKSMRLVSENDNFAFYYNQKTLAIGLKNKKTDETFFSNPYNAQSDPYLSGEIEKNLESQIVISYTDIYNKSYSLWSSADCVEYGQFKIDEYKNGIRAELSIGKDISQDFLPLAFTEERFSEMSELLEGRDKRKFNSLYTLYSAEDITDNEMKGKLLKEFPKLSETPLYIATELTAKEKADISGYFKAAGYTKAQYKADIKSIGFEAKTEAFPNFSLAVEYVLTDEGLKVTIPNDSISYDEENYTLYSIRLLEYFGADKPENNKDGYLFIPDGSGAVISFNNQTNNRRVIITNPVYGADAAKEQNVNESAGLRYYLPVYGIVRNDKTALFAVIESGDAASEITAKLGAPNSEYYTAFNTFNCTTQELVNVNTKVVALNTGKSIYLYDKNRTKSDFTVMFYPLFGEEANYSGMAKVYKKHLAGKGMKEKSDASQINLGIDTIGTFLYKDTFLGIKYDANANLTTYLQNKDILSYFIENGVDNLSLTLQGWMKNGLDSGVANTVKLSNDLGGKKDLNELLEFCKQNNIDLFPAADLQFVSSDKMFDGFSKNRDASKQLNGLIAGKSIFQPDIQKYADISYTISPHKYGKYFTDFFRKYDSLKINNIDLTTMGTYLTSNFKSGSEINRTETLNIVTEFLKNKAQKYNLSFEGANGYVLPFASVLKSVPMTNSGYLGETASVPFLQLVVSGNARYYSSPVNLSDDPKTELLRCIESGTSPSFILADDNVMRLKGTKYSYYYAVDFNVLKESITENYKYVQTALACAQGTKLVGNHQISDGIVYSEFENGAKIYINYTNSDYTQNDIQIESKSFTVKSK